MATLDQYQLKIHRIGRLSFAVALLLFFLIPGIVCAYHGILPSLKTLVSASMGLFLILTPIAISEIVSFVPLLGAGASYLAFETGNVSNLKLPCAMNAMKLAGVEPGTETAEVLSTVSVAVSSIVTTLVIALGVVLLVPLAPVFKNPYVVTATKYIMPALFGALLLSFVADSGDKVKGKWKAMLPPMAIIALVHYLVMPISGLEGVAILLMIPVTIFGARFMFKKGWIGVSD